MKINEMCQNVNDITALFHWFADVNHSLNKTRNSEEFTGGA